ncbi:tetraacyldisaccharide 4'-kinase [Seleniivibrio sp.]|uniref:tetraacyldisaccharide 4'-kinase n=1 Tax=Seleniivibrio sp. TaxID=2898801 RepID=UPI0025EF6568|nr:tetraacyldisaccharide 4'-kinase [Seleniivibrio sp.]
MEKIKMAKIISVGNISLGGTGKTPFTIMIAKHFLEQGKKVCVLSRGYRGKIGYDTHVISNGEEVLIGAELAADEPYMIAVNCPGAIVITGKERIKSYEYAEREFAPDIYILDDGFQHKRMKRDIDICLLDHKRPVSTGWMFPFGYLREPASAISRADIVVFTRAENDTIPEKTAKYIKDKPVFFSDIEFAGFYNEDGKIEEDMKGKNVLAFAGIASPYKFFSFLKKIGVNVASKKIFGDHHIYLDREGYSMMKKAKDLELDCLVTTEKDYVKLTDDMKQDTIYTKIDINLRNRERFFQILDMR